ALAPFARKTQVEGALDLLALPAALDDVALEHLEEQVRAAAGGVLFLARDHVARAHGAAALAPARADTDAAQGRVAEVAAVLGEGKARLHRRRLVLAQPQIGGARARVDDLARVHAALGIPDGL